ncbi:MAG: hypothetical protein CL886_09045 [Dehalococcoidia bacterium]|nr:hypothetical protein [Dehalococcoidia bacterium]|tara:strand:+ start:5960 stop:7141 length:1182 start_codon:yes stop_codon:yes gene_type:complete
MAVLGQKNQSVLNEILFTATETWACPFDARVIVTVIGGGGGGGAAYWNNAAASAAAAGGGSGAVCKSLLTVASGTSYVATVGGAGSYNSGDEAQGGTGGDSSWKVSGGSALLKANGGVGGTGQSSNTTNTPSTTGGAGGAVGTTGNIFGVAGARGGNAVVSNYDGNGYHIAAAGGAAPGIFGLAHRGGDASCTTSNYNKCIAAGGGGVWGRGGDLVATNGNGIEMSGGGGTAFGAGYDFTANVDRDWWTAGETANSYTYNFVNRGMTLNYRLSTQAAESSMHTGQSASIFDGLWGAAGSVTTSGANSYPGPGGGGTGYHHNIYYGASSTGGYVSPGLFGGGGGGAQKTGSSGTYGGTGSYGGGGGGAAAYSSSDSYSGMGGGGLVVLSIVEYL